jgi:hypothetical protein
MASILIFVEDVLQDTTGLVVSHFVAGIDTA